MVLKILCFGDLFLGDHPLAYSFGVHSELKKGTSLSEILSPLNSYKNQYDFIIGNLECPISSRSNHIDYFKNCMRCDPENIKDFNNQFFNTLSIANNHILDHGIESYYDTIEFLEKNNINIIGKPNHPFIKNKNGIKTCIIGFSLIKDNSSNNACYNKGNFLDLKNIIKNVKKKCDFLIVNLHWGDEHIEYPSAEQILIGRELVDLGVNIVIGGHSHVFQGYEEYNKSLIIYSLGNLLFDIKLINLNHYCNILEIVINENNIKTNLNLYEIDHKNYKLRKISMKKYHKLSLKYQNINQKITTISNINKYSKFYKIKYYLRRKKIKLIEKYKFLINFNKYPNNFKKNIIKKYLLKK